MSAIKIALLLFSALTISHALPIGPIDLGRYIPTSVMDNTSEITDQEAADFIGDLGQVVIEHLVPENHQEMSADILDIIEDGIIDTDDVDIGRVEELIVRYVPEEHSGITAELLEAAHLVEDQLDEERIEEIPETVEQAANKAIEYFIEDDRTKDQVQKVSKVLLGIAEEIIKLAE